MFPYEMEHLLHGAFLEICLVPVVGLFLQTDAGSLEDRVLALLLLGGVVLESSQGGTSQDDDDGQVQDSHNAHEHVGQVPHGADLHAGADEDEDHGVDAEEDHKLLGGDLLHDVGQAVIHIVQVADQGGEGKEHHGHGDEDGADGAEGGGQGGLNIGSALQLGGGFHAGAQQHEGGGGADE